VGKTAVLVTPRMSKARPGLGDAQFERFASRLEREASGNSASGIDLESLQLAIDLIEEDPGQPRHNFDAQELQQLAQTVLREGVLHPIVVRRHPTKDGRYIINQGARRYRASLLAGKPTIPAVVSQTVTRSAQMIENLQRAALKPEEIAKAIAEEIARGSSQSTIAEMWGVSESFVTQHYALLNLPAPIDALFRTARCSDVTLLYSLAVLWRRDEAAVPQWIELLDDDLMAVTRSSVRLLREDIESRRGERGRAGHKSDIRELSAGRQDRSREQGGTRAKGSKGRPGSGDDLPATANVRALEEELSTHLHTRVNLRCRKDGSGDITLKFHSADAREELIAFLRQERRL
jgi:ParB family transcriptional regulator, chromosome partitioning protein